MLLHKSFFSPIQDGNRPTRVPEFAWTEIAKAFVSSYPKESLPLLDPILEHFGDKNSVTFPNSSAISVATEITRRYPDESWARIVKYLGPPTTSHSFWIESWLRGDDYFKDLGALALIPAEMIWTWVDDNPTVRAPYLASFIPKSPFSMISKVCPRELIVRYGSDEEVGRQLIMNLDTGMVSETPEEKKKRFVDLKSQEQNPLVRAWVDEYIGLTDRFGKMLKRLDEREFPEQNERDVL